MGAPDERERNIERENEKGEVNALGAHARKRMPQLQFLMLSTGTVSVVPYGTHKTVLRVP